jgi:hypothetical protein
MHGIINESYKHDQDHSSDSPMKQRTTWHSADMDTSI